MAGLTVKDKIKICGEEFEFEKDEIDNLYLAFNEIKRIKKSLYAFGEVGIIIKDGKVERTKINQILKATDKKKALNKL
jgi:hypothetical protein